VVGWSTGWYWIAESEKKNTPSQAIKDYEVEINLMGLRLVKERSESMYAGRDEVVMFDLVPQCRKRASWNGWSRRIRIRIVV